VKKISRLVLVSCGALLLFGGTAFAHCDGLDGPVVQAAQKAIATGDVNLVLIWVQKADEDQIKKAFKETLAVRKLNSEARELADTHFFETLVRLHRASEDAGFNGLKPAGRDLGPAIPAADKALLDGNLNDLKLKRLLLDAVDRGVSEHFSKAMSKKISTRTMSKRVENL
jgi:hypothetical protein